MQGLEEVSSEIRSRLERTNLAREEVLKTSREVIQFSSKAIRAIHRAELAEARLLIDAAGQRVHTVFNALVAFPEVYQAGYIHDSQKEYVEAETMYSIVRDAPLPSFENLGVEPAAFLNGIAEAASESRRFVLDCLRVGDTLRAEAAMKVMDEIYFELIGFDFPDAITGGLRRTTDALRAVLERTRGDLTLTQSQRRLEAAIRELSESMQVSNIEK